MNPAMKTLYTVYTVILFGATSLVMAVDLPTWQVGDRWEIEDSFTAEFQSDDPEFEVSLETELRYRLSVEEIAPQSSPHAGLHTVYRRVRSDGEVSGEGEASGGGFSGDLRWKPGSTVTGEMWTRLSDLAVVRESYRIEGGLQAEVIFFGWQDIASVSLSFDIEYGPPVEFADFPVARLSETWNNPLEILLGGLTQITFVENFPWPTGKPPDISTPVANLTQTSLGFQFMGQTERQGFPQTYHVSAPAMGDLWYEPSIKDFVEFQTELFDFGELGGLRGFQRRVIDHLLQADPSITNLNFSPSHPQPGGATQLTGVTAPQSGVTARLLADGVSVETVSDGGGGFLLTIPSPNRDDTSPASDDGGSFGIEIEVEGVGRKVITLELSLPRATTDGSWVLY